MPSRLSGFARHQFHTRKDAKTRQDAKKEMDLLDFFIRNRSEVLQLTLEHLLLVVVAVTAGAAVGIPVGVLLTRRPRLAKPVLAAANVLQTIPSLALF
ncbi:MAG TPA: hypothetical protein VLU47_14700, partial [Blastocatellia bacterium]|nr:hypothetical protein [Blastocatellia bacterium]